MTLPCEQFHFEWANDVSEFCRCQYTRKEHSVAAAIRAEQAQKLADADLAFTEGCAALQREIDDQAEALAAKDRETANLTLERDRTMEAFKTCGANFATEHNRRKQAEAKVATLTAQVTALEKWVREVGHPDHCASVGIADEGDGQIVRYSSGKPCDCGLAALLTQEPTP